MQKNAILNAVALVIALAANGLANGIPLNGYNTGELSDMYPNLFVPAGLTFSIWGLIYLLLIGFVVNGFLKSMDEGSTLYRRIGWLFALNCFFNAAWIFAWHYLQIELSLGIMLGLLATLILIYLRINGEANTSLREHWLVQIPFSIYLGWISVATIANVTTLLVHYGWTGGEHEVLYTQIMIGIAALLGVVMLLRRYDFAYALVIAWALFGIWWKRKALPETEDATIATTALVCLNVVGVALIWRLFNRQK